MNKLINKIFYLFSFSSVIFLVVGIILTLFPEISLAIISYSISIILIVLGINLVVEKSKYFFLSGFTIGIISLVLGILILITPNILTNIVPIVLGILIIINGSTKLRLSIAIKNAGNNNCLVSMIIAIVNIICGVVLLANPTFGAITITTFIGIILIIYSIADLIDAIIIKKEIRDFSKIFKR